MATVKLVMILGLILSTFGTILIWIDSQLFIKRIMGFLLEVISTIGVKQEKNANQDNFNVLRKSIQEFTQFKTRGFILLLFGFMVQIISVLC